MREAPPAAQMGKLALNPREADRQAKAS